jgi:hypothetical protein
MQSDSTPVQETVQIVVCHVALLYVLVGGTQPISGAFHPTANAQICGDPTVLVNTCRTCMNDQMQWKGAGGHFNPMVSTMMAVWGDLPWRRLPLYIVAQLLGAILGSGFQYMTLPEKLQTAKLAAVQVCLVNLPASHMRHMHLLSACKSVHESMPYSSALSTVLSSMAGDRL